MVTLASSLDSDIAEFEKIAGKLLKKEWHRRFGKPTDQTILASYQSRKSVWRAGMAIGLSAQTMCDRLHNMGCPPTGNRWVSEQEVARIKEYYSETLAADFDLNQLARELERTKTYVCRLASQMGLTAMDRPSSAQAIASLKAASKDMWKHKPHPRGFLGWRHSADTRLLLSKRSKRAWSTMKAFGTGNMSPKNRAAVSRRMSLLAASRPADKTYTRARGGRRVDIGNIYFRSSWEANYARYLNLLVRLGAVEKWEFEPTTFWFDGVKRGTNSYKPDFRIFYKNDPIPEYVELKGWETVKDRTKWRRMAKYHPEIKLVVIGVKQYRSLANKWASSIPNWEKPNNKPPAFALNEANGVKVTVVPA